MKRHGYVLATVVIALAACAQLHIPGTGWETLIDGEKGMENFNPIGDANWHPENGAIVADKGKAGFLVTKKSYADFELRAEFYADTDTNSGVFIRCADPQKIGGATCYEVNIWDIRPEPKYGTGAIVDVAAVPVPIKNTAGGKWNTYEITAKGSQLTVRLNGVQTADAQDSKHAAGPFALQMGPGVKGVQGGPIKWRKVQVRPL
jgi:hypothetical protein